MTSCLGSVGLDDAGAVGLVPARGSDFGRRFTHWLAVSVRVVYAFVGAMRGWASFGEVSGVGFVVVETAKAVLSL